MNKLLVVVAVAIGVPAHAGGLKITHVAPKQGQVATVVSEEALDGTVSVGKNSSPLTQKESASYTEEVVAVDGDTVTKAKITVTDSERDGQALPTKGKSYTVSASGGTITVAGADGKDVADPEKTIAAHLADDVGKPDKLLALMGTKTFAKGQKVALTADEVASLFTQGEGLTVKKMSLALSAQDATTATFALTGQLTGSQEGLSVTMDVNATIKVEIATSRALDFAMKGAITGKGEADGQKLAMKATVTAHRSMTYK